MIDPILSKENPSFEPTYIGNVRECYKCVDDPRLFLVYTSDRAAARRSAFPITIPGKGNVFTSMTHQWLNLMETHQLISSLHASGYRKLYHHLLGDEFSALKLSPSEIRRLNGQTVIVRRAEHLLPIVCTVQGYDIDGKVGHERQRAATAPYAQLEPGPLCLAATKNDPDADLSPQDTLRILERFFIKSDIRLSPEKISRCLRENALALYQRAHDHALERKVLIAKSVFEFGLVSTDDGDSLSPMVVGRFLTPDSTIYWDAETYDPELSPNAFSEQQITARLKAFAAKTGQHRGIHSAIDSETISSIAGMYGELNRRLFS